MQCIESYITVQQNKDAYISIGVVFYFDPTAEHTRLALSDVRVARIAATGTASFPGTDGGTVTRSVGEAFLVVNGKSAMVPVTFGEEGEVRVIGASTLAAFGLAYNPAAGILEPVKEL